MRILAPRYYLISLVLLYVLHLLMDYYLIKVNENLENSLYFLPSTPIVCVCNHGSIENILMVSR